MNKYMYRIVVVVLSFILAIVSFYMLCVHIPYYQHFHGLDEIRNEICETNHYEYMDYFNEHRGKQVYYILKVKINGVLSYVVYDEDQKLVDLYQGEVADIDSVKNAILEKYQDDVTSEDLDTLEIGYENDKFVYYVKVQRKDKLLYIYYDLAKGTFLKAYNIAKEI